jgi:hypothetical protein
MAKGKDSAASMQEICLKLQFFGDLAQWRFFCDRKPINFGGWDGA